MKMSIYFWLYIMTIMEEKIDDNDETAVSEEYYNTFESIGEAIVANPDDLSLFLPVGEPMRRQFSVWIKEDMAKGLQAS